MKRPTKQTMIVLMEMIDLIEKEKIEMKVKEGGFSQNIDSLKT